MNLFKTTLALTLLLVAFSVPIYGTMSIGTMNPNGSNQHLICVDPGMPEHVHWSPDLTKITYCSNPNSDGHQEIYSYDINQDMSCQLTDYNESYGQAGSRFYDNSIIWYRYHRSSGNVSEYRDISFDGCNIVDTSTLFPNPGWNHLGVFDLSDNYICFGVQMGSNGNTEEIFVAPINDISNYTQITTNSLPDRAPDISSDETKIVYLQAYGAGRTNNVFVMNIDGTNNTQITFEPDGSVYGPRIEPPFWSPDGSQIGYSYYDGSQWDIYVMNSDGSDLNNITNTNGYNERAWDWQEGKILFTTDAHGLVYATAVAAQESDLIIPLKYFPVIATAAWQVGLCWEPTDYELLEVSFEGAAVENWGFKNYNIDNENQNVLIYAAVGQDFDYILTGEDTVLAYLHFVNPLHTYDSVCILEPYISTDSLALVLDTCTINGDGLLFADTFKIPEPGVFYPNVMFDTSWAFSYPDYVYQPGNVNNNDTLSNGEPEINLIDILYLINYVYGTPAGPAPKPPSSGDVNGDCVVNLIDILMLINCKYGNPPVCDFVCGCVESSPLNKIGSTMERYSDAPYGGSLSTEYGDGKTIIMLDAAYVIKGIEMELKLSDVSANVSCMIEGLQVYSRPEGDMITLAVFDINGQHQIKKGLSILLEINGEAEIVSAYAGGQNAEPLYLEIAGSTADSPIIPDKFALHQNHPNPFNPVTQISFELPVEAHVALDVYNIMGQKVSTVADRKFAPGYHTVEWDGSSCASGVYFYQIQAGDVVETRKMMLLK